MAARRERERRRPPAERRYRFATSDADIAPEEQVLEDELEEEGEIAAPPARRTAGTDGSAARATSRAAAATREPAPTRSFTAYKSEYAYVVSDLRRIVVVVGSLLVVLILLYFILPR
jgi:hypothetical protein